MSGFSSSQGLACWHSVLFYMCSKGKGKSFPSSSCPLLPPPDFLSSSQASLTVLLLTVSLVGQCPQSLESQGLSNVHYFLNIRMFLFSP